MAQRVDIIKSYELFLAVGLAGGVLLTIGLSMNHLLASLGARMMLLIQRPFRQGDTISACGATGRVETINLLYTRLTTTDNTTIHIPHSRLVAEGNANFSTKNTRRIDMLFGIGHDQDVEAAQDIIEEVLSKDRRILEHPQAQVSTTEVAGSSVFITARPWVLAKDYWPVTIDTTEQVGNQFEAEDVLMTYPRRTAEADPMPLYPGRKPAAP